MQPPATNNNAEPFPAIDTDVPRSPASDATPPRRTQTRATASSSLSGRLRRVSQSFGQSELPEGFSAATGGIASSILSGKTKPTLIAATTTRGPPSPPEKTQQENNGSTSAPSTVSKGAEEPPPAAAPFANGYHFPPAKSFAQSTKLGALAFWQYFTTPIGFLVTIYGLNIVAWGGMLFLLLCNACKAPYKLSCGKTSANLELKQPRPCATRLAMISTRQGGNGSNGTHRFSMRCSASRDSDLHPGDSVTCISCSSIGS